MKRAYLIIIIAITFFSPSSSFGRANIFWSLPVIVDESAQHWDPGYRIGMAGWYSVDSNKQVGCLFSMNYWNSGGELLAIELFPSLRHGRLFGDFDSLSLFVQFGIGYTFVDGKIDQKISIVPACADCSTVRATQTTMLDYGNFGLNIGIGFHTISSGKLNLEVLPMYHLGFEGNDINSFVSLNFGLLLGSR